MNLYFTLHLLFNHLIFQVYYEFMHFKSVAFPQPFFGCLARFHFIFFCQPLFRNTFDSRYSFQVYYPLTKSGMCQPKTGLVYAAMMSETLALTSLIRSLGAISI